MASRFVRQNETKIVRENEWIERAASLCAAKYTSHLRSRSLAQYLESEHADLVTSNMSKAVRKGKVFVDWSQNDEHKTTICVYSLRAREEPTVSTPVAWNEVENCLKRKKAGLLKFRSDQALARVEKLGDLFDPVEKLKQKLPKKLKA
jgi:bifunctional non-homologous end joining protein LigD